jgi:4'-phosphopantetheinyl transferase
MFCGVLADHGGGAQAAMTASTIFYSVRAETPSETESEPPARPRARVTMLARALLSNMLADIWDIPPHEAEIRSERSGRPYLAAKGVHRLPFISLSHSRGWVACAATEVGPVGIDIERQRPGRDHGGISAVAFGPLERARVTGAGVGAFYRIWTLREAIAKASGQGLALATDGRDRAHDGPDQGEWVTTLDGSRWALSHRFMEDDVNLATAVMLSDPAQRVAHARWGGGLNTGQ